ncbi:MAG: hypothetical protein LBE81_09010 [Azonexus sp.]|jgi:predicted DNA-binding transcriptional regulator AlpA|uniref:hypothetical protein n=1 Tax=Azonexus sp. TaxID=1872668 RepID=UPI002817502F|nr:hypothetical protein [Azonexus sp.]MDR0776761.1 hypothetical protein [Azonexus sp.]
MSRIDKSGGVNAESMTLESVLVATGYSRPELIASITTGAFPPPTVFNGDCYEWLVADLQGFAFTKKTERV